ncbi:MAG TPA: HAD hydrolase-like protein [Candidatus Scatovivens faecipullorum]|nr:HAD hydrolase-like protein [Candidatus Scatovivens faecipullorum]
MNYYFDFDNTLYETAKLTEVMLNAIVNSIYNKTGKNLEDLKKYAKENFNSTTGNIFNFAEEMAEKFKSDKNKVLEDLNNAIYSGESIVFEDARRFVEKLYKNNNKLYILTYIPDKKNHDYQMKKIIGSGIAKYFNSIIITSEYKFNLSLDYKNGIFFDDDPRDLNGLFEKNPIKVIRIRKENNKRSKIDMENKEIEEYKTFDDIKI